MNDPKNTRLPVRDFRSPATLDAIDVELASGDDLTRQIQTIQSMSEQPQSTTWRRAILLWLRIYQWEKVEGSKARTLDLRIPIPVPVLGLFFRRQLAWDQALRVVRALRRMPGDEEMIEPYLDSCMAMEFLRMEEEKGSKKELLVIGFD